MPPPPRRQYDARYSIAVCLSASPARARVFSMLTRSGERQRPTDNLILAANRKLFPIKIPNSHHQLRHYISTADAGRIYVVVGRIINSIEISTGKLEIITIVPFDPKCLTAGLGWIAVGGSDHGDCAFIKLRGPPTPSSSSPSRGQDGGGRDPRADVDAPLPLGISSPLQPLPSRLPDVLVHQFGGSIVNSITLHRLPAINDFYAPEDVAIVSNNDHTVSIFSLTRQEMIETIPHPIHMNYAIMSPDSRLLAAVGDEHRIYFYHPTPCPKRRVCVPEGDKLLCGWDWTLLRSTELDSDSNPHDECCFTIAFSPSSHLCAVGSQAGIITVFDVKGVLDTEVEDRNGREDIVCVFRSSRGSYEGGAVRSMSFSPRMWDLLVWVEEYGRVGVADIRQAFFRRQIIDLDVEDPALERIQVETHREAGHADSDSESENRAEYPFDEAPDAPGAGRRNASLLDSERQAVRENLTRELTDRERRIINFLNTAQWASTFDEGPQARLTRLLSPAPHSNSPLGLQQPGNRSPLSSSPPERPGARHEAPRDSTQSRSRGGQPRRRNSVVLSQDATNPTAPPPLDAQNSALVPHPTITLTWTEPPSQVPRSSSPLETAGSNNAGPSGTAVGLGNGQGSSSSSGNRSQHGPHRARVLLDRSLGIHAGNVQRRRSQRSRSIPRRSERPEGNGERPDSALAAERLRINRQAALEEMQVEQHDRMRRELEEQQIRRFRESEQPRISPWTRRDLNDVGYYGARDRERQQELGVGTAGIGWDVDGHTLYIGTEKGILQYQIDMRDRRTFPGFSYR